MKLKIKNVYFLIIIIFFVLFLCPLLYSYKSKVLTNNRSTIGNFVVENKGSWVELVSTSSWFGKSLLGNPKNSTTIFWNSGLWWMGDSDLVAVSSHLESQTYNDCTLINFNWGTACLVNSPKKSSNKTIAIISQYNFIVAANTKNSLDSFLGSILTIEKSIGNQEQA